MRNFILLLVLLCTSLTASANNPVLLFSDIESGPNSGWSAGEPGKGAAVTIWGSGFESNRGASFVTVNGTALTANVDYAVWGEYWPTEHFQKITFWLNDAVINGSGEITVTVDGVESNPLPFTVRAGTIHFITASNDGGDGSLDDPFDVDNASSDWIDDMAPGDLYYFRDATIYDGEYNGGNSCIWIRRSETSGTAALPIALLAFPGEKPVFEIPTFSTNFNNALRLSNNYMVYAGFTIDSEWLGASIAGDFHRFIGNDVVGLKDFYGAGTGIVTTGDNNAHTGDGNKILGNAIHGGNSQNRFDHAIYLSGCADNGGGEVGWNHFYDNDFGRGPIISINHQGNRCEPSQVLDAHFVFNNIVDCSVQRATAINVFDLSFDTGEPEPEPTYVYNNVFISCGTFDGADNNVGYAPAIVHNAAGRARFYNNTLYDAGYVGFRIRGVDDSQVKNNIIHMSADFAGPTGNRYMSIDNEPVVSLSNNLYFGLGNYTTCADCALDQNNIDNLDPLFMDAGMLDFNLQPGSPAIDVGTDDLLFEVAPPSYAPVERDLNFTLRSSTPTLGTYDTEDAALPVDLISFTGRALPKYNLLEWQTASEMNTEYHLLKRSDNGVTNWQDVAPRLLPAQASARNNGERAYALSDPTPLPSTYYRVVSHDFDGAMQLSEIIRVDRSGSAARPLMASPNPARGYTTITVKNRTSERLSIQIFNVSGVEVFNDTFHGEAYEVNTKSLVAGVYVFRIEGENGLRGRGRFVRQ